MQTNTLQSRQAVAAPLSGDPAQVLLVVFFALLLFPLLFILRFLDNNTLVSWQWTISREVFPRLFLLLLTGIPVTAMLARYLPLEKIPLAAIPPIGLVWLSPMWCVSEPLIDAGRYFLQAKYLATYGLPVFLREWGRDLWVWTDLPLTATLYGVIVSLFGEERFWLQAVNSVLFTCSLWVTALVGQRLWDKTTGLAAGILLMSMPLYFVQASFTLNDSHLLFLFVLSILLHLMAVDHGRFSIVAAALSLAALLLTKYSAFFFATIHLVPAVLAGVRGEREKRQRSCLVLLLAFLFVMPFWVMKHEVVLSQLSLLLTYQAEGLGRWRESHLSTFLFHVHPFVVFLALPAMAIACRKKEQAFLFLGWLPLAALALGVGRSRYLFPLLPIMALFAANGLYRFVHSPWARRALLLAILFSSALQAYGGAVPFLQKISMANLQDAGNWIDRHATGPVTVHFLPQSASSGDTYALLPLLDLYTRADLLPAGTRPAPARHRQYQNSLQFTEEMEEARFYRERQRKKTRTHVVLSSQPVDRRTAEDVTRCGQGAIVDRFWRDSAVFRYKALVTMVESDPPC